MCEELVRKVEVLKVREYNGYQVRTERVSYNDDDPTVLRSAYTPDGDYIGSPERARYLIDKRGIKPEKISPDHNICSIGFCAEEQKWYGWSHRAIFGFGIGDKLFEEDFGDDHTHFSEHGSITIETVEQTKQAAINFADFVA